jgi:hypothetical protein
MTWEDIVEDCAQRIDIFLDGITLMKMESYFAPWMFLRNL